MTHPSPHRTPTSRLLPILLALSLAANGLLAWRVWRPAPPESTPRTPPEMAAYAALGSNLAENNHIPDLKWSEPQFTAFVAGIRASYEGAGLPLDEDARTLRDEISARVQTMIAAREPDPVEGYFAALRDKENVQRTASGLHYRITLEGEGPRPTQTDTVVVSYAARTPDGQKLDQLAGVRIRVQVTDLLPGLAEGVQLLQAGGKALVYVPASLSFGDGAWPEGVPRGMPIGFFLELHEIVRE